MSMLHVKPGALAPRLAARLSLAYADLTVVLVELDAVAHLEFEDVDDLTWNRGV